ncbi:MAG TPA: hypothetical protein VHK63_03330, partial [Candidatus Limnocylindria bacterium]|nr:hypothetical protein [Candidatus Limnocylindria bacterium]
EEMGGAAVRLARAIDYIGAGTIEFLLDEEGRYAFLEMNTRLQVEHGVTELVTGLDLVAWQIRIAQGERLPAAVAEAELRGNAVEVRIYAEDPWNDFRPLGGTVAAWRPPSGPGVRVDHAVRAGMPLPPEYDPLLAKLMVHAVDRPAMVARLRRALDETLVGGVQTDLGFHRWLVDQRAFASGEYDTDLVPVHWGSGPDVTPEQARLAAAAAAGARDEQVTQAASPRPAPAAGQHSRWSVAARQEALRR